MPSSPNTKAKTPIGDTQQQDTMSLAKVLEPIMKQAAGLYQKALASELNKMGK